MLSKFPSYPIGALALGKEMETHDDREKNSDQGGFVQSYCLSCSLSLANRILEFSSFRSF